MSIKAMSYEQNGISRKVGNSIKKFFFENTGILVALIVIFGILSFLSPVFLTQDNMFNVLRQVSTNAYLALGMTFVIITGGIDLSVGAMVALSGVFSVGLVSNAGFNPVIAIICGLLLGTGVGLFNGVVIAYTKMPAFIVTMAVMNICRGAGLVYTNGAPIRMDTETGFANLGVGYLGPVPLPVIFMVIFIVVLAIILNRTKFGTYVYAIGGNKEAAFYSGIEVKKVEVKVYMLAGFLSSFSGIILSARMFSGQPTVAEGFELDAIAACVLGGVSMSGGRGNISGTIIGVLIIGFINNGLTLLSVNSFVQLVIKGAVILIAVYIDILKKQKSEEA